MIGSDTREKWLSRRCEDRQSILPLSALGQLAAGVSIFYAVDELDVEELADGSRYVVEIVDGGTSTRRIRDF